MHDGHTVEFFEDPRDFLEVAGERLAADPVVSSVVSMIATRWARSHDEGEAPEVDHPLWWAVVRNPAGDLGGAAMGTAPFPPYPPFLLPMSDAAARALARAVTSQLGLEPGGVNGALPAAEVAAQVWARGDATAHVHEHTRLFEAREVTWPDRPTGWLRLARTEESDLVHRWFRDFHGEADEQAGRAPDVAAGEHVTIEDSVQRVEEERVWFWVTGEDTPVHMTAANVPAFGVNRIGPVFTPPEHRGHGYAGRAVAEVSRLLLDRGLRVCLFTDQANPVSNGIYRAIGYRPVVDMANFRIE